MKSLRPEAEVGCDDQSTKMVAAYVNAVTALTGMPLSAEREVAVTVVLFRLAGFAADLDAFVLGDDVEIAGTFSP